MLIKLIFNLYMSSMYHDNTAVEYMGKNTNMKMAHPL
jgi:hypothetical protein